MCEVLGIQRWTRCGHYHLANEKRHANKSTESYVDNAVHQGRGRDERLPILLVWKRGAREEQASQKRDRGGKMYLKYKEADVQSQREMKAASMLKGAARATQSCCQIHSETGRGAREPGLYHRRLCTAVITCFLKYFTQMGASEQKIPAPVS